MYNALFIYGMLKEHQAGLSALSDEKQEVQQLRHNRYYIHQSSK